LFEALEAAAFVIKIILEKSHIHVKVSYSRESIIFT